MSKIFFMPEPSVMGIWPNTPETEYKDGASVFIFSQEDGSNEAAYSVCKVTPAYRAVLGGLRRAWTSAVCESAAFAPANATSVIMVKDGIAEQQPDGTWKVKVKAVIDYPS